MGRLSQAISRSTAIITMMPTSTPTANSWPLLSESKRSSSWANWATCSKER